MEGLGVVGDGGPQRLRVEATVASKGVAAFVFMAWSVREYLDCEQEPGKRLTGHTIARPMKHLTPTLETTLPETALNKRPAQAAVKKKEGLSQTAQPAAKRIRTVLVASHGWPTDAGKPSTKRSVQR